MLWWEEQSWQSWLSWIKKLISVAARYAALWSAERRRSTCQLRIVPGFSSIICLYLWSGWVARRSKRTASQWLNGGEHISGNGAATVAPVPRRAQKTLADLLDPKSNYLIQLYWPSELSCAPHSLVGLVVLLYVLYAHVWVVYTSKIQNWRVGTYAVKKKGRD